MERWSIAECTTNKQPEYYLANGSQTVLAFSRSAKKFDVFAFLRGLEQVGFPVKYTEGISQVNFTVLKKYYGWYEDNEIWVDVCRRRRSRTILATFVHEVAHHIDYGADEAISKQLTAERCRRGRRIHSQAGRGDDEYLARGFERFYSFRPRDRQDLRRHHPKLYRTIVALDRKYRSKP